MTDLQAVFDAFFIKLPSVDFTGKESQIFQFFKSAIVKCLRKTYDDLSYTYDETSKSGNFSTIVSEATIELLSMYMVKEYFVQSFALISGRKQYLGTQAFNKIPTNKEQFETISQSLQYWDNEIDKFLMDFPDYSEER
jgi:hypothetical protein